MRQHDGVIRTVIGVVQTLRTRLTADDGRGGSAFVPITAASRPATVVCRVVGAEIAVDEIRAIVQEVAPGAAVRLSPFQPFERTLGQPRFLAILLGTLGVLTIALTIVGIFGVANHEVARRTREVGIRIALGADASRILRMVLRRVPLPAGMGVAAGVCGSLLWTRTLRSVLFGLEPNDPASFLMSGALVLALVTVAGLIPAWRASHVEPTVALRHE